MRLAEVLGISDPLGNLDLVIAKATALALRAKDPALRPEPKARRPKAPLRMPTNPRADAAPAAPSPKPSRYIAAGTKRQLFKRAGYRCEFVSATGNRCPQKTHLQVDHIFPFRWGGSNSLANLALLCGAHNRRKFE